MSFNYYYFKKVVGEKYIVRKDFNLLRKKIYSKLE